MKTRKVRNTIKEAFIGLLERDDVSYEILDQTTKDFTFVATELSSAQFHAYVERAMCLREKEETGRNTISFNEYCERKYSTGCFHILRKDQALFMANVCYA